MDHEKILKANLPEGPPWEIEEESDLDKFVEGVGDSFDEDKAFVATLADVRNPLKTVQLEDLEKEFGLPPNSPLSEADRRIKLLGEKTDNNSTATHEQLEDAFVQRGIDNLSVIPNSPPVDPRIFLNDIGSTYCDGDTAFCDHEGAVCGGLDGDLVVIGLMDGAEDFQIPDESGYWPLIFFVAGDVERDAITNELLAIESAVIDAARREEIRTEILKYKTMFSWAILLADFI